MVVAEKLVEALALDDQRIERRQDMHQLAAGPRSPPPASRGSAQCGTSGALSIVTGTSILRLTRASISALTGFLLRRVEITDRIKAHHALRPQRPIQQIGDGLPLRRRLGFLVPAEMPLHQLIGLEHARAGADGERCRRKRPAAARAWTACGWPRDGPSRPARHRRYRGSTARRRCGSALITLLDLLRRHRCEPVARVPPMRLHGGRGRTAGPASARRQRMGPVFEDRFVHRLRLRQMRRADSPGMREYRMWWWQRSITLMVSICT